MRLIDADKLLELLKEQKEKETGTYKKGINEGLNIAKSIINDETQSPTAYDVENVVEQLEEQKEVYSPVAQEGYFKGKVAGLCDAIDIVKRGIVSDDDVCEWKYNDEFEFAKSECGTIDTHRIAFRKLKFCPYCGKKIKVVE